MRSDTSGIRGVLNALPAEAPAGVYFSQFGEDIIMWHYLSNISHGFYVDVGAHDPFRFSNTYLLHKYRMWTGLNVDADHRAIARFELARPGDVNVCAVVAKDERVVEFFDYEDGAIGTADPLMVERHASAASVRSRQCTTTTLSKLLELHLPPSAVPDLLSIDVEGFDLEVLSSNDWSRWRPRLVAVEDHGYGKGEIDSEIHVYLLERNYKMIGRTVATSLYMRG